MLLYNVPRETWGFNMKHEVIKKFKELLNTKVGKVFSIILLVFIVLVVYEKLN